MPRYLFFISYIGARFRGIQRQLPHSVNDPSTVQGCIEGALQLLKPAQKPVLRTASRTDKGVHALKSAFHIDLETCQGNPYDCGSLLYQLNRYFEKESIAIWIQKCQQVPDNFNSRSQAIRRTYLYRLATRRKDAPPLKKTFLAQIPYAEWRRCHFVLYPEFDIEKFKQTSQLLVGPHDFRTFMGISRDKKRELSQEEVDTKREILSFDVTPGHPMVSPRFCEISSQYDFWEVSCSSRSFLFRQVRRMVGALVCVATGHLQPEDIERMLANPSKHSWPPKAKIVPPYGLYLANIEYNPEDLKIPEVTEQVSCAVSQGEKSEGTVDEVEEKIETVLEVEKSEETVTGRSERQIG